MIFKQLIVTWRLFDLGSFNLFMGVNTTLIGGF